MSITNKVKIFETGEIVKLVKKQTEFNNEIRFGMIENITKYDDNIQYDIDFGQGTHGWSNPSLRKATEQEKFMYCTYGPKINEEKTMKERKFIKFCKHYVGGQFNTTFRIMSYSVMVYFLLLALAAIICGGIDMIFFSAPITIITVGVIAGVSASVVAAIAIFCFFGFLISLLTCEIYGEIIR